MLVMQNIEATLNDGVDRVIGDYFKESSYRKLPVGIYDTIVKQVEKSLFHHVLKAVRGNQVRAAEVLGINRNTLRTRMQEYKIKAGNYIIRGVN